MNSSWAGLTCPFTGLPPTPLTISPHFNPLSSTGILRFPVLFRCPGWGCLLFHRSLCSFPVSASPLFSSYFLPPLPLCISSTYIHINSLYVLYIKANFLQGGEKICPEKIGIFLPVSPGGGSFPQSS